MPELNPTAVEHDNFLAWPNGGGETPCSSRYAELFYAKEAVDARCAAAESDEDWPRWSLEAAQAQRLDDELRALREAGHVGAPLAYDQPSPLMALLGGASMTASGEVFNGDHLVGRL